MLESKSQLLRVVRRCQEYTGNTETQDEVLLLEAGIMPRSVLERIHGSYPSKLIEACGNKLLVSDSYIRANPRDRTRPIVTRFDVEKPRISHGRYPTTYRVYGRDRLLLWYAAANEDFSGSRGESYGLWLVLRFLRTPKALRRFRLFLQRPRFRIPKDAL